MSYCLHASHKNKTYAAVHNMTGCSPGNCRKKGEGSADVSKKETTEKYSDGLLYGIFSRRSRNCFANGNSSVFAGNGDPDDSFLYDERGGFLKSGKSKYLLVSKGQTLHTHLFLKIPQRIINTKISTCEKTMQ